MAADESSPLLGNDSSNANNVRPPRRPQHRPTLSVASITSITLPKANDHTLFINLLCILVFVVNSAGGFIDIPQVRLVEDALCHRYYEQLQPSTGGTDTNQLPISEEMCKVEPVQTKMAYILAIMSALDATFGFLSALPWGLVADRIGRKPVMSLGFVGISLSVFWTMLVLAFPGTFPVWLIWLGSVWRLIGGGTPVLVALVFSMLTDATTDSQRAVVFMRIHVASICGELFSPSMASLLMEFKGPWTSIWLGAGLLPACAITVLFLPETFKSTAKPEEEGMLEANDTRPESRLTHLKKRLKDSMSILKSPSLILLLIACLFTASYSSSTSTTMIQFISRRFHMKLEQGGYVQSLYGLAQTIHSLLILPWLSHYAVKRTSGSPADTHRRDLIFLRASSFLITIGSLVLGLAPDLALFISGLMILALGTGYISLIRSLLSLYVDPEHRSRLFGIVAMAEIIGTIYARPMLAALFSLGMKLGGLWIGLPYYGVMLLFASITILFAFVRVPEQADHLPAQN